MGPGLAATLVITALAMCLFGFARWRVKQPAEPLKVRRVNDQLSQFASVIVVLMMAAHPGGYPY